MRIAVSTEATMCAAEGGVWTQAPFDTAFWGRYEHAFDDVVVVARDQPDLADGGTAGLNRVDGPGFEIVLLPAFGLGRGFSARQVLRIVATGWRIVGRAEVIMLRPPGLVAAFLSVLALVRHRPIALEVAGDPADAFRPGAFKGRLRPLLRLVFWLELRWTASRAVGASYVTAGVLQRRYPAKRARARSHYSSIHLPEAAFHERRDPADRTDPADVPRRPGTGRLITVTSLATPQKGVDSLLVALDRVRRAGRDVELVVVGGGRTQPTLEAMARDLGLDGVVVFTGWITSRERIWELLDSADGFLLASRQEGLPRSLLEAMARSLPCAASLVGGVGEVLDDEWTFDCEDRARLATLMGRLADGGDDVDAAGPCNHAVARDFAAPVLEERRRTYYAEVRDAVAARRSSGAARLTRRRR